MKKLLLILFFLPMIGFGQIMGLEYYLPGGNAALSGNIIAADYIPLVDHEYTDFPDSLYGNTYTLNNGLPTFASGHYYYHPATEIGRELIINGLPYFQVFGSGVLNNNLPFIWDWYSIIDSATNAGVDTFLYDVNNNVIRNIMHSTFTFNSIPPQVMLEQHNITEYIYDTNNKIIQIDFTQKVTYTGQAPYILSETNHLFYDGSGRLIKVELPFNSELIYNYGNNGVSSVSLYQSNNFIDTVNICTYDANGIISEFINKEYLLVDLMHVSDLKYNINHDTNGRYIYRSHELWDSVLNNWDMQNEWYFLYNNQTAINDVLNLAKTLLKVTDLLGRETKPKANTPLFYIYDDGTVEKRIVIE